MDSLFPWRLRSCGFAGAAGVRWPAFCNPANAATPSVTFGGGTTALYNFRPAAVTIHPGDSVIWSKADGTHTDTNANKFGIWICRVVKQ